METHRPKRLTSEVVERIRKLAISNPDLGLRQIGYHFNPPISHDTIGKVLRGERGPTIGQDGRMLRHAGGRKKLRADHIPRTQREKAIADYWYERGRKDSDVEKSSEFKSALSREVNIQVV